MQEHNTHLSIDDMNAIVSDCQFPEYTIELGHSRSGFIFLQAHYLEADTVTGAMEFQHTRRWAISPNATKSEIVATAFKCCLTSMEHKTREWFLYRGKAIYQPHYDVDALHAICDQREMRDCEAAK